MYIDADAVIKAGALLGAIGALLAAIISVYKGVEMDKRSRPSSAMGCGAHCRG